MKKNYQTLLWGLALILLGLGFILRQAGVITFNIWEYIFPVILIFIGLNALANSRKNIVAYVLLFLGGFLIIRNITGFEFNIWYLIAAILILIGIRIITSGFITGGGTRPSGDAFVMFSGRVDKNFTEDYKGSSVTCIFGGYEIDLSEHKFVNDMTFNFFTLFGGSEITVPENVNLIVSPTAVFGGVDNVTHNTNDNEYTVHINAVCLFGGIEINNRKKRK